MMKQVPVSEPMCWNKWIFLISKRKGIGNVLPYNESPMTPPSKVLLNGQVVIHVEGSC